MNLNELLKISSEYKPKYIGVGKIMLESDSESYNVPHLHFLLAKGDNRIEAVNLEFGLVSTGLNPSEASSNLAGMLIEFVKKTISEFGYDNLIEQAKLDVYSDLWTIYRGMEFSFAKTKNDLSHAFVKEIEEQVKTALMNRYGFKTDLNYSFEKEAA